MQLRFMRFLLPFIILFSVFSVFGQTKRTMTLPSPKPPTALKGDIVVSKPQVNCVIETKNLLPVRNLKIGMDSTEVRKIFPLIEIKDSYQKYLQSGLMLFLRKSEKLTDYQDVQSMFVHFVDHKLVGMRIEYEPDIEWESIDEYKDQVSKAMNIPPNVWEVSSVNKYGSAQVECKDFTVNLSVYKTADEISYSFDLAKKNYILDAINREKEEIENKKKTFKP